VHPPGVQGAEGLWAKSPKAAVLMHNVKSVFVNTKI